MKSQEMKFNRLLLISLLFMQAILLLAGQDAKAQFTILNNNKLRLGNGTENSVNSSGNLQQPFYFNSVSNVWRPLTYSVYPLDNAYAIGGDKTNEWNLNGTIAQNPILTNQVINSSGFTVTSESNGYGTIVSTGNITIGGSLLEIENSYTLPQSSAYVEVKVKVKNVSLAPIENVRIWIGTRDDNVGGTDRPTKQKGNLVDGAFQKIASAATRSAALKIFTTDEGILFYTNSDRGNTIIQGCCEWQKVINQNPQSSTVEATNDGSYGFYVRMNDLAIGESDNFVWYYAAGELADLNEIIGEVAAVSGNISDITSSSANFKATSSVAATGYWMVVPKDAEAPTAAQIKAGLNYGSVVIAKGGSGAMEADVEVIYNMSGLSPSTNYDFYFVSEDDTPQYSDVFSTQFATLALPSISTIDNVTICQDLTSSATPFTVGDAETAAESLLLSAVSGNTDLLPNANISFGGSGTDRNVTVSPASGQTGSTEVTVTVTDADGDSETTTFTLNVSINDTESPIASDPTYTLGSTAIALSNNVTGENLTWYNVAVGGSGTVTDIVPNTSMVGKEEYWVSQTVNGCESGRTKITVTVLFPNEISGSTESKPSFFPLSAVVDGEIEITGPGEITDPQVYVASGFQTGDVLLYAGDLPVGTTKSYDPATGTLSFIGTATASEWEAVFRNIRFRTSSVNTGDRAINFILANGVSLTIGNQPHFYQFVPGNITWDAAKTAAAGKIFFGLPGYLATVTSQEENDFIENKLESDGWIAGSDDYEQINAALGTNTFADQNAAEGKWYWITGPEAGTAISINNTTPVAVNDAFMNWNPGGEPNNSGNEHYMQLFSTQDGKWNDLQAGSSLEGYVVEFGGYEGEPVANIEHSRVLTFNAESGIKLSTSTIDENNSIADSIGTLTTLGADSGLTLTYALVTGTGSDDNALFTINTDTLKTAEVYDYENTHSLSLLISVNDDFGGSYKQTFEITVNNKNDNAPIIAADQNFDIDENSNNETVVGKVVVEDPDGDTTYENWIIQGGNTNHAFAIDPVTGEITINDSTVLDYESNVSFTLSLTVGDGENTSEEIEVTINLNNLNDTAPIIAADQGFSIDENSENGMVVGSVSTSDADGDTTFENWTIVSGNIDGAFAIDPVSGEITITDSAAVDYEINHVFNLEIAVSDGVNVSEAVFVTIGVNNLNDTAPIVAADQSFDIDENSGNGLSVGTVAVTDADGETTYNWSIEGGNIDDAFSIDPLTGEITVNNLEALDYEVNASFTLELTVSDGTHMVSQTITIDVNNLNDNAPEIASDQNYSIDENTANSTIAGAVLVSDADGETLYRDWTIIDGNINNAFSIDTETGVFTVNSSEILDYEVNSSFTLTITVGDGENTSEPKTIVIDLNNLNDTAPVIASGFTYALDENTASGYVVGTLSASDADGNTTYENWSIVSGNVDDAFVIDPSTGEISVRTSNALDFDTTPVITLTLTVSDGINTSDMQDVRIDLNNFNDNSPTELTLSNNFLFEGVSVGTEVGLMETVDADAIDTFSYTLVSGEGDMDNTAFSIEGDYLYTSQALNFDMKNTLTIRVRTTDSGGEYYEKAFAIELEANTELDLSLPTAFTPNGDGYNDTWEVDRLLSYPDSQVKIFNSDGFEVFSNVGYTKQWDGTYNGKEMGFGTYYYMIKLNGTSGKVYRGTVMILK